MSWLLDTCALSEYAKKAPSTEVITWLDEQDEASLFISVISLGEIEKGILKLRASDPRRSQKLPPGWASWSSVSPDASCRSMPPRSTFGHKSPHIRSWPGSPCQ